jgi:hypothetical protein
MQTHSITTVIPIENIQTVKSLPQCDKEKHKEMALDAAETVLGFFIFDRTVYDNFNKKNKVRQRKWYQELREQAARDIETEMH